MIPKTFYNVTGQRNFNKRTDNCTLVWEQRLHTHYLTLQHSQERGNEQVLHLHLVVGNVRI